MRVRGLDFETAGVRDLDFETAGVRGLDFKTAGVRDLDCETAGVRRFLLIWNHPSIRINSDEKLWYKETGRKVLLFKSMK